MCAFICVAVVLVFANAYLFRLYRLPAKNDTRTHPWGPAWLDFDPSELGGPSYWQLGLASAIALFMELLMVRWISSEIPVFAYFKNFVLIACFLGFGLGCCLCSRRVRPMSWFLPLTVITLLVSLPWAQLREVLRSCFWSWVGFYSGIPAYRWHPSTGTFSSSVQDSFC